MVQGMGGTRSGDDERLAGLRAMAEQRNAWRDRRRVVVCELAVWLAPEEGVCELRAGQDDVDTVVTLVTDRRVLIGRQAGPSAAIVIEAVDLDDVTAVGTDVDVAGDVRITWTSGSTEIHRLSSVDAQVVVAAIRQRMRSKQRSVLTRPRERKPKSDFEFLDALKAAGILTHDEVTGVRERIIQEIAVRPEPTRPPERVRRPAA